MTSGTVSILVEGVSMHFQFLIEDQSSAALIEILMQRISARTSNVTFSCKAFKGLGGFTKKNTVKETKTGKLLNDLTTYLRGFNKSLQGFPSAIFVVLDNDERDTDKFRDELNQIARQNNITVDHVFCIAVEEIEAWFLGDENAILAAYPSAKLAKLHTYVQDSICGTWEFLAEVVYPGGLFKLQRDCSSYMEIGRYKYEWAKNIGVHMDMEHNNSPSFMYFISEINKRMV